MAIPNIRYLTLLMPWCKTDDESQNQNHRKRSVSLDMHCPCY